MIYFGQLAAIGKKALGSKAVQTNVKDLIQKLPLDPTVTGMDACVLSMKDLAGLNGRRVVEAVKGKHPDIRVLLFCSKEAELKSISWITDMADIVIESKVTKELITEHVSNLMADIDVKEVTTTVISKDSLAGNFDTHANEPKAIVVEEAPEPVAVSVLEKPAAELAPAEDLAVEFPAEPVPEPEPVTKPMSLEERIRAQEAAPDFEILLQATKADAAMRELLQSSSEYVGITNMLEILNRQVMAVYTDDTLSHEEKMIKIRDIGLNRANLKGKERSMLVGKIISIMTTVTAVTTSAMEHRLATIKKGLDEVAMFQTYFKEQARLQGILEERHKINAELNDYMVNIVRIFATMDAEADKIIRSMENAGPSDNPYVNAVFTSAKNFFIPENARDIALELANAIRENRVALSSIKDEISGFIFLLFKLCDADHEIIVAQQNLIDRLKAQRVEDVIIAETVIKTALKIFIGPNHVGTTATALTWSGVMARRQNTLVIDLRPTQRFSVYGQTYITSDEFVNTRPEAPILCVHGNFDGDVESLDEFMLEVSSRLNYYAHVHLILEDSQTAILNRLADSALVVNFIVDGTDRGLALGRNILAAYKDKGNTAKKLIFVNCPVNALELMDQLEADPLKFKAIDIPYLQDIRAYALRGLRPYDSSDICTVFEEAFR